MYLGALPELSVSYLREQGFRKAWEGDSREVNYLYANSYERDAAADVFSHWLDSGNAMPDALFTTSFSLLQGVLDVALKRNGRLPENMVISTFGDNELLDFLGCPVLSLAQRHRDIAERILELVLASLDEKQKPETGIRRIRRDLCRRGSLGRKQ